MPAYYLPEIRELALQLKLSPVWQRLGQIEGVERLACEIIEPAKAYPFELVCFHITGYRPKNGELDGSLPGKELIHDLVRLCEDVTAASPPPAGSVPGTLFDTAALAGKLDVSTKTIQRWRTRGLVGIRVAQADGTTMLGFSASAVERFVARHADLVRRAASFKNLSADEKAGIVARARELGNVRRTTLHEVAKRIAAETSRAVETIRYTLRRHDRQNPEHALFDAAGRPVVNVGHDRLYRAYRGGATLDELAARESLTLTAVKRIVREMRVRELQADPPEYIFNAEFDAPDADDRILCGAVEPASGSDLLSREEERDLFRRYNHLKCKARTQLDALEPIKVKVAALRQIEKLLADAEVVRNRIAQANLRLVTSIAKRHVGPRDGFTEVVSDGNVSLLRAIEKFDYARGNKFSTYASWAIMRNFARTIPEERYLTARYLTGAEDTLAAAADRRADSRPDWRLGGAREAIEQVFSLLSAKECKVVRGRFGLTEQGTPQTLATMGRVFGVTKERIRQIERDALTKLRAALSPNHQDLFD